ncbi:MAG TPA: tRNA (adenosine(37)-N6)-dimethylallyltransferase MiaA [Acidimicrobiales bacterium]|nr:tRNA (adenosine(37)-N6)-dimethylallyltransferase MiaA [Acidimicrobiales bacterium]
MVGPTASGKSAVAVGVAAALGDVEIVTADSMQVYRGMDLGTAKPSAADRAGVAHHLLDVADPADEMTLVAWTAAARAAVAAIEARGRRALLVGGTGLYVQALVDGFEPPGRWPEVRAALDADPDTAGMHRRLAALDPRAAGRMEPTNRRRVVRALEVTIGSGRPFSAFGPGVASYPPTRWRIAGLWQPRGVAAARIADRFAGMVDAGFVAEVRRLVDAGPLSRTARQALGYREVLAHLEGGVPLDRAMAEAVTRTRAFARRQRMWWRRDPRITWVGTGADPLAATPVLLGDWGAR